jgi:hypothetical protein
MTAADRVILLCSGRFELAWGAKGAQMTRIVDHRSALPFGPVVEVHVRHDPDAETAVFATVSVSAFGASPDPEAFPHPLPTTDAFLQALAYAERVGIACVWIDDPGGHFPPEKRPVRDVNAP